MNVGSSREGAVLVLRFEDGDVLDAASAPEVKARVLAEIDGGADLALDLSAVEHIDSAGLGVLVSAYKAARLAGRNAVIFGVRPGPLRVMRLIRLDEIFDLQPHRAAALAFLGR